MYKILGLTGILISSVMTGFFMAKGLDERVKFLKEIRQASEQIKSDFEYRAPVLSECFENRGAFFSKVSEYIKDESFTPCEAVERACEEFKVLGKEEKDILLSFGKNLSSEEIQGQISNMSRLTKELDATILKAQEESGTKGRLYKSSGVLAGLGFVILLL